MYSINGITFIPSQDQKTVTVILPDLSQYTATIEAARKLYRHQQQLIANPIANASDVDFNDRCPQHNNPVKKEYRYGRCDAVVFTFQKCNCSVCHTGFPNKPKYFTSYQSASSTATMQKALNSVF